MNRDGLFRDEVASISAVDAFGRVLLTRSKLLSATVPIIFVFFSFLIYYISTATYTKRSTVFGEVTPVGGLIEVSTRQSGTVVQKYFDEGQRVQKGSVLYKISSERFTSENLGHQEETSKQASINGQRVRDEIENMERSFTVSALALKKKVESVQLNLDSLLMQRRLQMSRLQIAAESLRRAEKLVAQGFLSKEALQARYAEKIDHTARLSAISREILQMEAELAQQLAQQENLPGENAARIGTLERQLSTYVQGLSDSEAIREFNVRAPIGGIIATSNGHIGQTAELGKTLATMIPDGAQMEVHLYAPSRAVGFVKSGDLVRIRYQAYPYQKFGVFKGTVIALSEAASHRLSNSNGTTSNGTNEPYFRVRVRMAAQAGDRLPTLSLRAGMAVEADIMQENRRLVEWMFDPFYRISRK